MTVLPTFRVGDMTFGGRERLKVSEWLPGDYTIEREITKLPLDDAAIPGRGRHYGRTMSFKLFTDVHTQGEAWELVERFTRLWAGDDVRDTPGATMYLHYRVDGRWRCVPGVPGRISSPDGDILTILGRAEFVADFETVSPYTFSSEEGLAVVSMRPTSSYGGLITPLTTPITTGAFSRAAKAGRLVVGGTQATHPIIRIDGPIIDPEVRTDEWALSLRASVPWGEHLVVDCRPWVRATYLNGHPVAGVLDYRTDLAEITLRPGTYNLVLMGAAPTGQPTVTVRWRDAWRSI